MRILVCAKKRALQISAAASVLAVVGLILCATVTGCGTAISSSTPVSQSNTTQGQSQPPTGPMLGYIWDAGSQSLRPIQGVPGASVIGSAVLTAGGQGGGFIASSFSSVSGMAVFLDANGGVFQAPLAGGPLSKVASLPGATALTLSHSGGYALVTGRMATGASNASVISGLPQAAAVRNLNLSGLASVLGGAASDTGTVVLATGASEVGVSGVSFESFAGQGAGTQIATAQAFGGLQFVPNGDELVFADGASGALTAISHVNTTPSTAVLAADGSISAPVALDITPNGRWVVAANHGGDVLRIDLTGGTAATKVHCSCVPSQVVALSGSTVRLATAGAGPLWIVDAGNSAPRVLFVPAITAARVPTTATKSGL